MQTLFQIQLQFMAGTVLLLLCRPLLNRFPKIVSYGLWCVLFLRLLCPFSLPTDSAIWSVQDISEMAEQGAWQETDKEEKTADGNIAGGTGQTIAEDTAGGTGQTETGSIGEKGGQTGAGNAVGGVSQTEAGKYTNNAGQNEAERGIDGANRSKTGEYTNDAGQSEAERGIDGANQFETGEYTNDAGQTGTKTAIEEVEQGGAGTGRLGNTGNGTDGTGQTEDGNTIQKVGSSIAFAVKNLLAAIYHWLDTHTVLFAGIWAAGIVLYLSYALYAVYRYRRYVDRAVICPGRKRVYESSQITIPFVFGILHKKIILPRGLSDDEQEYIVCHEEMHIRRNDHLVKWVIFLLTGIYWFQPLAWVAAYYLEQDMEMSCDEMVIRNMGEGIRKAYAQSLLSFAEGRQQEILPLAFASGGVKWRIRNVLRPKQSRRWMLPVSVMLVLAFAVVLFTEQREQAEQNGQKIQADVRQDGERTSVANSDRAADNTDPVTAANTSAGKNNLDDPAPPKEYIYHEDVTHDGIEDTITLNMTALRNESLATGEEETVTVTSGKTGKKIASYTADTVHYGWNGLYLYENDLGKYLVNWKPMMYQGVGTFQLRVFSLKENGKEDVLLEKEFRFGLNPGKIDFDKKAFQDYVDLVNAYLRNSYVIVDTDQGEVIYATEEKQLIAPYDGSWVIDAYKELKKQGKN